MTHRSNTAVIDESLSEVLSNPDVQGAIVKALEKLPNIMEQYAELENIALFGKNFARDKDSVRFVMDGLQADLPEIQFNRDTLSAVITLVNKLPKLVELLTTLEPLLEFSRAVLNDRESLQGLIGGAENLVNPVKAKVMDSVSVLEEARERATKDTSNVNVFALMKLLRDPNVQYGVHVIQAFLSILEERKADEKSSK